MTVTAEERRRRKRRRMAGTECTHCIEVFDASVDVLVVELAWIGAAEEAVVVQHRCCTVAP
jgi:hypothetical protein